MLFPTSCARCIRRIGKPAYDQGGTGNFERAADGIVCRLCDQVLVCAEVYATWLPGGRRAFWMGASTVRFEERELPYAKLGLGSRFAG